MTRLLTEVHADVSLLLELLGAWRFLLMQVQALLREAADTLKGRVLLRYSGTEPKLRILVEAADGEEAEGWCVRLEEAVRAEFSR